MNIVYDIRDALSAIVEGQTGFSKSRFIWDTQKNNKSANFEYYSVRPQAANFVAGTCNTITLSQLFDIELGTSFRGGSDGDEDTDDNIKKLYEEHQKLFLSIMRSNFNIGRVQVVGDLDLSAPEVDNDNKVCRIIATYTITHRTE